MPPMNAVDEEEFSDIISLFNNDQEGCSNRETLIKYDQTGCSNRDIRNIGNKELVDIDENKHSIDEIQNNKEDLIPVSSYRKKSFVPISFLNNTNNIKLLTTCCPLSIKVIDCVRFPLGSRRWINRRASLNSKETCTNRLIGVKVIQTNIVIDSDTDDEVNCEQYVQNGMDLDNHNTYSKVATALKGIGTTITSINNSHKTKTLVSSGLNDEGISKKEMCNKISTDTLIHTMCEKFFKDNNDLDKSIKQKIQSNKNTKNDTKSKKYDKDLSNNTKRNILHNVETANRNINDSKKENESPFSEIELNKSCDNDASNHKYISSNGNSKHLQVEGESHDVCGINQSNQNGMKQINSYQSREEISMNKKILTIDRKHDTEKILPVSRSYTGSNRKPQNTNYLSHSNRNDAKKLDKNSLESCNNTFTSRQPPQLLTMPQKSPSALHPSQSQTLQRSPPTGHLQSQISFPGSVPALYSFLPVTSTVTSEPPSLCATSILNKLSLLPRQQNIGNQNQDAQQSYSSLPCFSKSTEMNNNVVSSMNTDSSSMNDGQRKENQNNELNRVAVSPQDQGFSKDVCHGQQTKTGIRVKDRDKINETLTFTLVSGSKQHQDAQQHDSSSPYLSNNTKYNNFNNNVNENTTGQQNENLNKELNRTTIRYADQVYNKGMYQIQEAKTGIRVMERDNETLTSGLVYGSKQHQDIRQHDLSTSHLSKNVEYNTLNNKLITHENTKGQRNEDQNMESSRFPIRYQDDCYNKVACQTQNAKTGIRVRDRDAINETVTSALVLGSKQNQDVRQNNSSSLHLSETFEFNNLNNKPITSENTRRQQNESQYNELNRPAEIYSDPRYHRNVYSTQRAKTGIYNRKKMSKNMSSLPVSEASSSRDSSKSHQLSHVTPQPKNSKQSQNERQHYSSLASTSKSIEFTNFNNYPGLSENIDRRRKINQDNGNNRLVVNHPNLEYNNYVDHTKKVKRKIEDLKQNDKHKTYNYKSSNKFQVNRSQDNRKIQRTNGYNTMRTVSEHTLPKYINQSRHITLNSIYPPSMQISNDRNISQLKNNNSGDYRGHEKYKYNNINVKKHSQNTGTSNGEYKEKTDSHKGKEVNEEPIAKKIKGNRYEYTNNGQSSNISRIHKNNENDKEQSGYNSDDTIIL
ncbi:putative uncharacterized protein DDB_G0282133 [Galleria mellonella]|uniref:GATA zinc finger domain-containing protein 14-like n=1 Tax=Galleria mellonella TaxID=7137 RepID=A0A6J3BWK4_GALME|nr:putative uncharacterized protein DDB_G0282133 [Galleria mellonella]